MTRISYWLALSATLLALCVACSTETPSTNPTAGSPTPVADAKKGVDEAGKAGKNGVAAGAGKTTKTASPKAPTAEKKPVSSSSGEPSRSLATFGAGCFWCVEAVLEQLEGVHSVESGYMGGHVENPTYKQVCSGRSGHAEVVQVEFDPAKVKFETLLVWFFKLHDPTTLNRQGNDVGPQYRSVVFYHSPEQQAAVQKAKRTLDESKVYSAPVVTEIAPAARFYPAEHYHQDFYKQNKRHGYCQAIIAPKLDKLGLDK